MNNPTTASPVTRSETVQEALDRMKYTGLTGIERKAFNIIAAYIAQLEAQPKPQSDEGLTNADYEEVLADHRRLVRELDVLLNGEHGAAKQASLCDIVSQVKRERLCLYRHTGTHPNEAALSQAPVPTSGAVEVPMSAKEWPDEVKEGIMWLMARIAHDDRSIYGGHADEERALIKYINNLRAQVRAQPPAADGKLREALEKLRKGPIHADRTAKHIAKGDTGRMYKSAIMDLADAYLEQRKLVVEALAVFDLAQSASGGGRG